MDQEQESTSPKNTVTVEDIGPCKKKVIVEVPQDAIKGKTDEQYQDLQKEAVVPGFRKGRAPRRLLEKRFGKETSEQVKLQILAEASDAAIKDNELNVFGEPDVSYEEIELPTEGALKFEFEVEVWPEFDLPELEGIPVTKPQMEVSDEQIDSELAQLRRLSGVWAPREDAPCELEDQLLADVVIKADDVEEAEKLDNTEVYARKNGFVGSVPVENLDEVLVGAKAGESKQVTVEVPKTYFREEYRGKKVDITIEIKDVKWLKPAELDAAFLERFESENEDDLKEKIRDMLDGALVDQVRPDTTEQT